MRFTTKSHKYGSMAKQFLLVLIFFSSFAHASAKNYTGFYDKLKRVDTGYGNDRVQVIAFFAYSSKASKEFEPALNQWLSQNKKNIVFQRIPSTFVVDGEAQARLYYTAEEFKAKRKLHEGLYQKVQNKRLVLDRNDLIANFLGSRLGQDPFRVEVAMDSLSVNARVLYAQDLSNKYRIPHLPAFVINGRYVTTLRQAKTPEMLLEVLDYLIDIELERYAF